jgi:hypothetical protein
VLYFNYVSIVGILLLNNAKFNNEYDSRYFQNLLELKIDEPLDDDTQTHTRTHASMHTPHNHQLQKKIHPKYFYLQKGYFMQGHLIKSLEECRRK